MVKSILMLALALAVPAATQPVTVEIVAIGQVVTPADRYQLDIQLTATADTQKAADALLAKNRAAFTARIKALGGQVIESTSGDEMVIDLNVVDEPVLDNMVDDAPPPKPSARVTLTIVTGSESAMTQARAAAEQLGGTAWPDRPSTSLANPAAAVAAAKDDAIGKAKVQADRYAAKLGLPAVTLVGVSERVDLGNLFMMTGGKGPPGFAPKTYANVIVTEVPLVVTFRLEPKP